MSKALVDLIKVLHSKGLLTPEESTKLLDTIISECKQLNSQPEIDP